MSLKKEVEGMGSFYVKEKDRVDVLKGVLMVFKRKGVIRDKYLVMRRVLKGGGERRWIEVWDGNGCLKKFGVEDVRNEKGGG